MHAIIVALFLCIALTANVYGQVVTLDNLNFLGAGARARSMGGAFISIADDGTALSWNPAGLIQVVDPQISFSLDYFHPKSTYDLSYSGNPEFNVADPLQDDRFPLSFAAFTAPIRIMDHPFVASVSYSVVSTRLSDYVTRVGYEEFDSPFVINESYDSRLNNLRLGFGTNVYKSLNFGAGVDIYFGKGYMDFGLQYENSYIDPVQNVPVNEVFKSSKADTITYTGLNFIGGFQWQGEKLRVGATMQMPFWLTQKHVVHYADTLWVNGLPMPSTGDIDELQKERIKIPWSLGFGASYKLTEDFMMAGDFEWKRFGTADIRLHFDTLLSNGDLEEQYYEFGLNMQNGYQLRMGGEYVLHPGFATLPLRAGFRYEVLGWLQHENLNYMYIIEEDGHESDSNLVETYKSGDPLHGLVISFGAGLHWELVKLDFAFEYDMRDNNSNGEDYYGSFDAVSEYRGTRIILNFTGLFK
jgi:long-subunit fatty acid transport protein